MQHFQYCQPLGNEILNKNKNIRKLYTKRSFNYLEKRLKNQKIIYIIIYIMNHPPRAHILGSYSLLRNNNEFL